MKPRKPIRSGDRLNRIIFAAFLVSGVAGLMHEVVWAKLLVQLIGATAYAQAVVLAVFMGGLALGSVLFGRRSDHNERPLRTYVILEVLIGGYCLLLPLLVQLAGMGYVSLATQFFESPGIKIVLRFGLVILLVLFPAVLMGGTLPILARRLISRVDQTQRQVANLYALNSLGAVLGAGLAGFVTLPFFGIYPSLAAASLLNFAAGGLLWGPARRETPPSPEKAVKKEKPEKPNRGTPVYQRSQYVVALVALALSGFAAMGYEVLFTRVIALSFGSSTYSFTVMLMSFITGIALGSSIISRVKVKRPLWLLALSQFTVVAALLLATPMVSRLPYLIALMRIELQDAPLGFEFYQVGKALLCWAILLLPTTCLGFGFPLVAQIQARNPGQIGARVGSTYAWNTLGNVLGVAVTSLVLLPHLGLLDGFHFNLALNLTAGMILLLVAGNVKLMPRIVAGAVVGLAVVIYLTVGTGWPDSINFARNHLRLRSGPSPSLSAGARFRHPASSFEAWKETYVGPRAGTRHFFQEDAHTTVLVSGNDENIQLFVNSKPDATTSRDLDTQLLLAHGPLFLAPEARTLLVIGYGSGITAGSALRHPIERADIVEISSAVLNADAIFRDYNYQVLDDPRVHTYQDDGQSFLRTVPHGYDVIISEPSNPWVAGIGGLFTVEFFETVRRKLNPGGLFTLWFHTYEQSDEGTRLLVRTLASVFPHVMLFGDDDMGNLVAVASLERIEPDFEAMEKRFQEPAVREDLARLGISNLLTFLSHHRISQDTFSEMIDPGELNRVGHERLEYWGPRTFFSRVNSFFIEEHDPLVQGVTEETDILFEHYRAYREDAGRPVTFREFEAAARYAQTMGGYGPQVARSIAARARRYGFVVRVGE
jgi:spermidine synthase/MFS family permease